tara:strand:- start:129 stop:278 length:150 start_codon:yes stop_codon:yes gene_type:complete
MKQYSYGSNKFKSKEAVVKFLKDGGHSKQWILGYLSIAEEVNKAVDETI